MFRHFGWGCCSCMWPRILLNIFLDFTLIEQGRKSYIGPLQSSPSENCLYFRQCCGSAMYIWTVYAGVVVDYIDTVSYKWTVYAGVVVDYAGTVSI